MAATVWAWPPLHYTARMLTWADLRSHSYGLSGKPFVSQSIRDRRVMEVDVAGRVDNGSAYVEALKRLQRGQLALVRVSMFSRSWWVPGTPGVRGEQPLEWKTGGEPLEWTTGGEPLLWTTGSAVAVDSHAPYGDYFRIRVTGLPPLSDVAFPSEIMTDDQGRTAMVLQPARSSVSGAAFIVIDKSLSGAEFVRIGDYGSAVFHIDEWPVSKQGTGSYGYNFRMIEVFEDEFDGGFEDVNPWS